MKQIIASHAVPGAFGENTPPRGRGTPTIFYDSVVVRSSGEQTFRSQAFTNNLATPVDLHAMRITLDLGLPEPTPTTVAAVGIVALRVVADGIPLTRGYIPVWNLAPSDRRGNNENVHNFMPWKFSHPLPLMPGKTIVVQAKHLGVISREITVRVAFAGRAVPVASPRRVPYAAVWASRFFDYDEDGFDSSPAAQIVNDTGRDLHVDRIIGRFSAYSDVFGLASDVQFTDFGDVSLQGVTSAFVRLSASQNHPIIRNYSQWRAVFGQNGAIETNFELRPNDYLNAEIHHVAGPALATAFDYFQGRGFVSMVGWREA